MCGPIFSNNHVEGSWYHRQVLVFKQKGLHSHTITFERQQLHILVLKDGMHTFSRIGHAAIVRIPEFQGAEAGTRPADGGPDSMANVFGHRVAMGWMALL